MNDTPHLSLVMPVYNEGRSLAGSLVAWHAALRATGLPFEMVVVDDGSTDDTATRLSEAALPGLIVVTQTNAGHGAALLAGYRRSRAPLVLQVDGDDEIGAGQFASLWEANQPDTLVIGRRASSSRAPVRRAITALSSLWLLALTGRRVRDPNVPYRLVPRRLLDDVVAATTGPVFAPNLLLTLHALRTGWPIVEVPVIERPRPQRRALGGRRLWAGVLSAWRESIRWVRQGRRS